jgi:hypothetical protein
MNESSEANGSPSSDSNVLEERSLHSSSSSPNRVPSTLSDLPIECVLHVLSFLSPRLVALTQGHILKLTLLFYRDLCTLCLVSTEWKEVAEDPALWYLLLTSPPLCTDVLTKHKETDVYEIQQI